MGFNVWLAEISAIFGLQSAKLLRSPEFALRLETSSDQYADACVVRPVRG